mmetsp:Transcript_7190/g.20784  ORF Transcript_7190/g.20784 Transcript_7190/m.20784 type:complete len:222 (+) Transcript_7190:551-1216(+)
MELLSERGLFLGEAPAKASEFIELEIFKVFPRRRKPPRGFRLWVPRRLPVPRGLFKLLVILVSPSSIPVLLHIHARAHVVVVWSSPPASTSPCCVFASGSPVSGRVAPCTSTTVVQVFTATDLPITTEPVALVAAVPAVGALAGASGAVFSTATLSQQVEDAATAPLARLRWRHVTVISTAVAPRPIEGGPNPEAIRSRDWVVKVDGGPPATPSALARIGA